MFEDLSRVPKVRTGQWLGVSGMLMLGLVVAGLAIVMLLNGGMVNQILTPVFQYLSLFGILWDENALGAIQFLLKKSLLTFAHEDAKSGLNIWTFEFDGYTIATYLAASLAAGRVVAHFFYTRQASDRKAVFFALAGLSLTAFSMTYMTAIAHCSGPTWVGFVSLYGLGLDEFQLYPVYQILVAVCGLFLLAMGFYRSKTRKSGI